MSRFGFKSDIYHGDVRLGELHTIPQHSPRSQRCPPISILQTISQFSVRCKLESSLPTQQSELVHLHASCIQNLQTLVSVVEDEEMHLVAMPSKSKKPLCFWCFSVPLGLYDTWLRMLNTRCLAIVFDLDETLIVANTMTSFDHRMEALRGRPIRETDPRRVSRMSAELRRYSDDRKLLRQYAETDCVEDNGRVFSVRTEEVPPLGDGHKKVARPVIRMKERNIVLTRINPEIRNTSVLLRLRPAWEDFRRYLNAKERKRFEVYVCSMAERDYALEMWRLLDPEAHLIGSKQILDRVICVKSGSRKSLLNVFQNGRCHPNMAMVIDDRSKVWEDMDQPRVHVVPAFTPYYAPQAEMANPVALLCKARNVACNVRGHFFKEFDEDFLQRISRVYYEDEVVSLPHPPDVSNCMIFKYPYSAPKSNANAPVSEGMNDAQVEQRLNQFLQDGKSSDESVTQPKGITVFGKCLKNRGNSVRFPRNFGVLRFAGKGIPMRRSWLKLGRDTNHVEFRHKTSQLPSGIISNVICPGSSRPLIPSQDPGLLGPPVRHGPDIRGPSLVEPPLILRPTTQTSPSSLLQPFTQQVKEDNTIRRVHQKVRHSGSIKESNGVKSDKPQPQPKSFSQSVSASPPNALLLQASQVKGEKRQRLPSSYQLSVAQNHAAFYSREFQSAARKLNLLPSQSIGVLNEIGRRCSSKVEFRSAVGTNKDFHFSMEVVFTGEKIGVGMGRSRKDAQEQAATNALRSLAEKYAAHVDAQREAVDSEFDKHSLGCENGFLWDEVNPESSELQREDGLP